jgi:VCBS repeat-containing protein
VRSNDDDPDGDTLDLTAVSSPEHGSAVIESGAVRYTPVANFFGADNFTYTVSDSQYSSTATVTIDVLPVDDPPLARGDQVTTDEDQPILIDVLANDSDVDGVGLLIDSVSAAAHGTVAIEGASVRYAPAENYHGADAFSYTLRDGKGRTATASVSVSITPVDDTPIVLPQQFNTQEDEPLSAQLVATDVDGDVLSFAIDQPPSHGQLTLATDGRFDYQPDANFSGSDRFLYTVSDGVTTVPAQVEITITAVNDAPQAQDDDLQVAAGSSVSFDVRSNDSDADGDALSVELLSSPAHGDLVEQQDGSFVYTPGTGFSGEDGFTYRVSDGQLQSAPATVRLIVLETRHAPVAVADSVDTDEDTPVTIAVLSNDTDADQDPLSVIAVSTPQHGSAVLNTDGSITYTPVADYFGADRFEYSVSDGNGGQDVGTVSITINPVNDLPTLAMIADQRLDEGQSLSIQLVAADIDGDDLSYGVIGTGSVLDASGLFTFTALDGDSMHAFTVQVSDGQSVAERRFTVSVANVAPTLSVTGAATAPEGLPYTIDLAASDPGQDSLSAWFVNWGDGQTESLPGTATQASHHYSRAGGRFTIEASASDEDGSYDATPLEVTVSRDLLNVESFTPTASGFKVRFDHAFDTRSIDLNNADGGVPDVQLIGDLVGPVSGSLLFDADGHGFSFIRSGGILPFDSYSVQLASGPLASTTSSAPSTATATARRVTTT